MFPNLQCRGHLICWAHPLNLYLELLLILDLDSYPRTMTKNTLATFKHKYVLAELNDCAFFPFKTFIYIVVLRA